MENNIYLKTGTAGGIFLSILPQLTSADLIKTILLATIGAIVSFGVTWLLKHFTKYKK